MKTEWNSVEWCTLFSGVFKCRYVSGVLSALLGNLKEMSWVVAYIVCEVFIDMFAFDLMFLANVFVGV